MRIVSWNIRAGAGQRVEPMAAQLGRWAPVERDEERTGPGSEIERLVADASAARSLLDWEPQVSLDDGLRATVGWIAENLDRYGVGAYTI